jgi:hexosaminidase
VHLHLSDDQGWRLEIRSHPDLAKVGGASEVGGGEGGSYTQDEYRDLVAYAQARGVTVVPEIDTPGHTNAALNAEPELTCDGVAPEVYTGTQVGFSTLCTTKESTYEWFDDVVGELAELTPGEWIHFGGDESHSTEADDYRTFVTRAAKIVTDHGKTPMGWEEIAAADLPDDVVVQHWLHGDPVAQAAADGASIVMSPSSKAYLDMKHVEGGSGNVWAGIISTETAYDWDPATVVDGVPAERVLGVEAPLWTELVDDLETVQQRTLPRLPAIAEIGWTAQDGRDWPSFRSRIAAHGAAWSERGWAYTRDAGIDWPS